MLVSQEDSSRYASILANIGYRTVETLYCTSVYCAFRVYDTENKQTLLVKIIADESAESSLVHDFYHDFSTGSQLKHPNIARYIQMKKIVGRIATMLVDNGGKILAQSIPAQGFAPNEFFSIAMQLIDALDYMHGKGILHLGLHPGMMQYTSQQVSLFDLSQTLDVSEAAHVGREPVSGLIDARYLAPEQKISGKQRLTVTTDLYALGLLFYQALTGRRLNPANFEKSLAELTLQPDENVLVEIQQSIQLALRKILYKLLAENPNDRYPSAEQLRHDMTLCYSALEKQELVAIFELSNEEKINRASHQKKLYGRKEELMRALAYYRQSDIGKTKILLISGPAGIGKSAFALEIMQQLKKEGTACYLGKCEPLKMDIPYYAIRKIFTLLVEKISTEPAPVLAQWRTQLQQALGVHGSIITQIIPALESIIGAQPAIPRAKPTEETQRLIHFFRRFVEACVQCSGTLVLIADDLQWSNKDGLVLLESLLLFPCKGLFLIGIYRSNEVNSQHPMASVLKKICTQPTTPEHIELMPLLPSIIAEMTMDSLGLPVRQSVTLAKRIAKSSEGNPLLIQLCIQWLNEQSNRQAPGHLPQKILTMLQAGDVSVILNACVAQFEISVQSLLKQAACLGNEFSLEHLAIVVGLDGRVIQAQLQPLVRRGMLSNLGTTYQFTHDKIHEAVYQTSSATEISRNHWDIAWSLYHQLVADEPGAPLYGVANHLLHAKEQQGTADEQLQIAKIYARVGDKALSECAYQMAQKYLHACHLQLQSYPDDIWEKEREFAFSVYENYARSCYYNGQFELAETHFKQLLDLAISSKCRARIAWELAQQYALLGKFNSAIDFSLQGLANLGIYVPKQPGRVQLLWYLMTTRMRIGAKPINRVLHYPEMTDEKAQLALSLLSELVIYAHSGANFRLYVLVVCHLVKISLGYGNAPASAYVYMAYGFMLTMSTNTIGRGLAFMKLALRLCESYPESGWRTKVWAGYAYSAHHWENPWESLGAQLHKVIEESYCSGNLYLRAWSCYAIYAWDPKVTLLTAIAESQALLKIAIDAQQPYACDAMKIFQLQWMNLSGVNKEPFSLSSPDFDANLQMKLWQQDGVVSVQGYYRLAKLQLYYYFGEYTQAVNSIPDIDAIATALGKSIGYVEFCFYACLSLSASYPQLSRANKRMADKRIRQEYRRVSRWAKRFPDNFLWRKLFIRAEQAVCHNKVQRAMKYYSAALQELSGRGYHRYELLIHTRAADFYLSLGQHDIAQMYWQRADEACQAWGAQAVADSLKKRYPQLAAVDVQPMMSEPLSLV